MNIIGTSLVALFASLLTLSSAPVDTNVLTRLNHIDSSIEVAQSIYGRALDRAKASAEEKRRRNPNDTSVIESAQEAVNAYSHLYNTTMTDLLRQKEIILSDAGLKLGFCEIHGERLVEREVQIKYGVYGPMPNAYSEARLIKFRNSDEPSPGGCVTSEDSPKSLKRLVCPACSKKRDDWLQKNLKAAPTNRSNFTTNPTDGPR